MKTKDIRSRYKRLFTFNSDSISARFKVDGAKVQKPTLGLRRRFLKRRSQQGDVAAIE